LGVGLDDPGIGVDRDVMLGGDRYREKDFALR